jgi:hypothetical protein
MPNKEEEEYAAHWRKRYMEQSAKLFAAQDKIRELEERLNQIERGAST